MKIVYSQIETEFRKSIEKECAKHIEKLERLLTKYSPELVQLHVSMEKTPRRDEYTCTLNLALPTGTLHATGSGAAVRTGAKNTFAEIEAQVKKHQQKLRRDYTWKRKRARGVLKAAEIPSAD